MLILGIMCFVSNRQNKNSQYIKITDFPYQKREIIDLFFHRGITFIKSVDELIKINDLDLLFPAGVNGHYAIELTLKGILLWEQECYEKTHVLSKLANQIHYLNSPDIKNRIKKIDNLSLLRYPLDNKHIEKNKKIAKNILYKIFQIFSH